MIFTGSSDGYFSSDVTSLMTLTICYLLLLTSLLLIIFINRSDINRSDKQMVSLEMTVTSPSDVTVIWSDGQFSKWQTDGKSHWFYAGCIKFLLIIVKVKFYLISKLLKVYLWIQKPEWQHQQHRHNEENSSGGWDWLRIPCYFHQAKTYEDLHALKISNSSIFIVIVRL